MTTLAERVLEAIEAAEALVAVRNKYHDWVPADHSWHTSYCGWRAGEFSDACECVVPAAVLRRCTADRKILDLHRPCDYNSGCATCDGDVYVSGHLASFPCTTLTALAEGLGVPLEQEET